MHRATPLHRLVPSLCAACIALYASPACAQTGLTDRLLLVDRNAYVVMPPESVCGPGVLMAAWSPSGEHLLAARARPRVLRSEVAAILAQGLPPSRVETTLVLWSRATGASATVWRAGAGAAVLGEIKWLVEAPVAFVVAQQQPAHASGQEAGPPESVLLRVDARTSQVTRVPNAPGTQPVGVYPSPRAPVAAVIYTREPPLGQGGPSVPQTAAVVLNGAGRVACQVQTPPGERPLVMQWTQDGRPVVRTSRTIQGKREVRSLLVDQRTGTTSALPQGTEMSEPPDQAEALEVTPGRAALTSGGATQRIGPLWLGVRGRPELGAVLLAADGSKPIVAPRATGVAYESQGIFCVSEVVRVPREAVEAGLERARQLALLNRGKQAALAMLMYAQDHSDELPTQDGFSPSLLEPYLREAGLLEGFVYTHGGGKLTSVPEPGSTEMGHYPGRGGRAVVYMDGHVVWQPDAAASP